MNDRTLDFMFDHWGSQRGWMSKLSSMFDLSSEDVKYLSWRRDQEDIVQDKLSSWEQEIERDGGLEIYNEEDLGKKLVMVHSRIDAIEKQADTFTSPESRMFFIELSDLDKWSGLRYRIRNQILAYEVPDRVVLITDAEIDRARSVRLDRVIKDLPKSHKILCPFHAEKSPSFHVSKWGYCFGCGKHIDSIGWVSGQLGYSFVDAVKWLNNLGI